LSQQLVELHGQHEHQALLDPLTHLPTLDAFARLEPLADQVGAAYTRVRAGREQLDRSRMDAREKSARLELIAFQLGEIERAGPKPHEDEQLAATRQILASAERVQRLCAEGYAALYDSDQAVLAGLGAVWKRVAELASIDPEFTVHLAARDGIKSQLEDLAQFLRSYGDAVDASPERLQQVDDRLALIERLKRKYGPMLQDVIDAGGTMRIERDLLTGAGAAAADLDGRLAAATADFLTAARELSSRRRAAAAQFARRIETLLGELSMARTRFEIRFSPELSADHWGERGVDQAEFFVSPNPGEDLRPLARIVSGGELSRVMLALKTLAAGDPPSPRLRRDLTEAPGAAAGAGGKTLIFDEVDAGIGGRVADVVGARLRELGDRFQVLCITHLPQIAARASTQFRMEKTLRGDRTVTTVERLDDGGRVDEIARMIGGSAISEGVRASAGELLRAGSASAAAGKDKAKPASRQHRG
jgi:DNA repair protein RecN (Recombination protein N)